jgi:hypothetical protein
VEVVHLYLERPGEPVSARFARDDAGELERRLLAAAAGMSGGSFPVSGAPHAGLCATCPGRGGLCSHPPVMTDREFPEPVAEDG